MPEICFVVLVFMFRGALLPELANAPCDTEHVISQHATNIILLYLTKPLVGLVDVTSLPTFW